ncbi:MAG: hypothetical protein ACREOH_05055 [Candidatus Entotheonellia bacterium]
MLRGAIDVMGQIQVPIELMATDGERLPLEALVDTGFTGTIGIRDGLVHTLGWEADGFVEAALARGSVDLPVFIGEIIFDGQRQVVRAIVITSDDIIVGLALLCDKRLLADFRTGEVTVD